MVDCGDKEDESGDEEEIPPRWHLKLVRHGLVCCLCVLLVMRPCKKSLLSGRQPL